MLLYFYIYFFSHDRGNSQYCTTHVGLTSPVTRTYSVHQTSPYLTDDRGVYTGKMQWSGGVHSLNS